MHGQGVIVLRLENHNFYEHRTIVEATAEAKRLAETLGGECVVYVPVKAVKPIERTTEEERWTPSEIAEGERLPF